MIDIAFIEACAPRVAHETMQQIIRVESGGDPLAMNANRPDGPARLRAKTIAEAISVAQREIDAGNSVDIGLMQVNSRNLKSLGLTVDAVFEPCTNLAAGAAILTEQYVIAATQHGPGRHALDASLSAYNTGDPRRGFRNGYVARVYAVPRVMNTAIPASGDAVAAIYTAAPIVSFSPMQEQPMSAASDKPIISTDYRDANLPGVVVELTPEDAERNGLVEESALSFHDAWVANADLADPALAPAGARPLHLVPPSTPEAGEGARHGE